MKKQIIIIAVFLLIGLTACGTPSTPSSAATPEEQTETITWQSQYDLGLRLLSEGNYEEAIIAFTAAIEIDPKQAPAYVGRGDAYILGGGSEDSITLAQTDYEAALELDNQLAAAWLGMVDAYIRMGEFDLAEETLRKALELIPDDEALSAKLNEMLAGEITDSSNRVHKSMSFLPDGTLHNYTIYEYGEGPHKTAWTHYDADGTVTGSCIVDFDAQGQSERYNHFDEEGTLFAQASFVYNEQGQKIEQYVYGSDGEMMNYFTFEYDENGRQIQYSGFKADGTRYGYWISEYDENGNRISEKQYNDSGELEYIDTYE